MTDYTDPETAREVAEWCGFECFVNYEDDVCINCDGTAKTFCPWSDDAPRWQLTALLEAMEKNIPNAWSSLRYQFARRIDASNPQLRIRHVLTADPRIVYESCVDVLRDEGEID